MREHLRRLFIVEDHHVMRRELELFVAGQVGVEVCGSACSAEEALDGLPAGADVVLVDVSLPGMSGLDLIRSVRERWPEIRCVVLSGHAAEQYAEPARAAGAFRYVMKGDVEELRDAIRAALLDGRAVAASTLS